MSLQIVKAGVLDTIQDHGRYGYQQLGINPGGVMDRYAASIANFLADNEADTALFELHFPASSFLFQKPALIAISGADFCPTINGKVVSINKPILINKDSLLEFKKNKSGNRAYLAIHKGLQIESWLHSKSTNLKAGMGGYQGSILKSGDIIPFKKNSIIRILNKEPFIQLSWQANTIWENEARPCLSILPGNEWSWLSTAAQSAFINNEYKIKPQSDRMGYRLESKSIITTHNEELISSGVSSGTIQLLPDGQLIVLMADHQTTGGYPRIAHIISAHQHKLAQMKSGEILCFKVTNQKTAENLLTIQQKHLQQLQNGCTLRLQQYFNEI